MRVHDSLIGVVMVLIWIGLLVESSRFPVPIGQPIGPGLFPSLLGVGLGICGVALIIDGWTRGLQRRLVVLAPWTRSGRVLRRVVLVPVGIVCYVVAAPTFGFVPTAVGILTALMVALGRRPFASALVAVVAAVGSSVALWTSAARSLAAWRVPSRVVGPGGIDGAAGGRVRSPSSSPTSW